MEYIKKGIWTDTVSWEFYLSNDLPDTSLCTAVFCVALFNNKLVLTRNHRGWECLGGHREPNESILDTLSREAYEEGGVCITSPTLIGFKKIISTEKIPNRAGGTYPYPHSFIPYFTANVNGSLQKPTGEEIFESKIFSKADLLTLPFTDHFIINSLLERRMITIE